MFVQYTLIHIHICYMNTHICNHMYYVIIVWVGQKCQYMKWIQFLISSDFNIRLNTYVHVFHIQLGLGN